MGLCRVQSHHPQYINSNAPLQSTSKPPYRKSVDDNLLPYQLPSMSSSSTQPRVLIIGAGLGGLALGQGLKLANIPFTIFERDRSASYRPQGYRIRINPDGSNALRATLPPAVFELFERTCPDIKLGGTNFNATTGELTGRREGLGGPPPPKTTPGPISMPLNAQTPPQPQVYNADRARLRQCLMYGLEDNIQFGKTFFTYSIDAAANVEPITIEFTDGSSASGTFLVGADGIWSAVRRQLLPADIPGLVDTDGRFIYGKTLLTPELEARVPPEALEWMTVISTKPQAVPGPGNAAPPLPAVDNPADAPVTLFMDMVRFSRSPAQAAALAQAQFEPVPDYVYWVLGSRALHVHKHLPSYSEGTDPGALDDALFDLSPDDVRALSLRITADWHEPFRAIIEQQLPGGASALRITSAVPVPPTPSSETSSAPPLGGLGMHRPGTEGYSIKPWTASPYVTLLGDAIHPMSPTGGVGANTALRDAANLLEVLKEVFGVGKNADERTVLTGVEKYEKEMRQYAGVAIQGSYFGGRMLYAQRPWAECKKIEER
jgi:2-polyprenyl-6-methoxyphenol hydroxylase-like FAD-dependent oxidoreductase